MKSHSPDGAAYTLTRLEHVNTEGRSTSAIAFDAVWPTATKRGAALTRLPSGLDLRQRSATLPWQNDSSFIAPQHGTNVSSRGYGATAARLTPDQKVGSLNLSALISN